jgi:lipopolysaccharide export system protein LptA
MRVLLFIWLVIVVGFSNAYAQRTVRVKQAGSLRQVVIDGESVQKLVEDVWLIHETTNIKCDSAYFYKSTNSAKAFGNVRITDAEDGLNLRGEYLEYDGNGRIAKMREKVILLDDSASLYTDYLDFDRNNQIGFYFNGGKLVDSTNVLTSISGYYNTQTKTSQFIDSVFLESPDYQLTTDTLNYSTLSKVLITRGNTEAFTFDGDTLRTKVGLLYNSNLKYSEVYYGNITTAAYEIKADSIFANDSIQFYEADYNVRMKSKEDSMTIFGEHMKYYRNQGKAIVYEDSYLRKFIQSDSLFIKGDTLLSIQDTIRNEKYLTAYRGVEMFKSDMQARADSVSYNLSDSTIYLYQNPIIWNVDSQIEADSINILIRNNVIHRMDLALNSFVITQDTAQNFNQVKGRNMKVYFVDGLITKADVDGNGESIYFAIDKKDGSSSMNKVICSNMALYFENNAVSELRMFSNVEGDYVPPFEIKEQDTKLRGFDWQEETRPKLLDIAKHLQKELIIPMGKKEKLPVKKG